MRSLDVRLLICVGVLLSAGCDRLSAEAERDRPNIVLIVADDLGYGDLQSYNPDSKIPTPSIDRLAAEGVRFTDAHTPSAVCTPTRYGLLTGRYAWRTHLKEGVLWGYSPALIKTGRMTVASLLQQEGYATAGIGKWHLGLGNRDSTDYTERLWPGPASAGFDYFYGIPSSLDIDPYVYIENDRVVAAPTDSIGTSDMRRHGGAGYWRAGAMAPGFRHDQVLPDITSRAVAYVQEQSIGRSEQPFFLYFPLTAPHTPWLPADRFTSSSGAGPYGDFVAQVDASVGELLDALDRNGKRDNTIVIFTSDNGAHWLESDIETHGHQANGPLRGQKADIWEGGHRVPFIARWPGQIDAGSARNETICLTDFMATAAAVTGATLPDDAAEDSFNFLPLLLGEQPETPIRPMAVHHSQRGMFAIRQGPWKLIEGLGSGGFTAPAFVEAEAGEAQGQLYNLAEDPSESVNLYDSRPEVAAHLSELLDRYRRQGYSRPRMTHQR